MKKNIHIYYDEEADFLEISFGKLDRGYFRDVGKGISERIDEKTGNVVGVAIMGLKRRIDMPKPIDISLPVDIPIQ